MRWMVKPLSRLADVNQFIAASRAARSADDLRALMEPITHEMGFHGYALFQHVKRFTWKRRRALAISNFSRSWLEHFFSERMYVYDPVLLASQRTAIGFRFDEVATLVDLNERQRELMSAARRAGIANGFCVPIHVPGEPDGICSFVVTDDAPLPLENLPMAQLVGCFAYEAARQLLLAGDKIIRPAFSRPLTNRQLECIVFVARGKTDWEISQILGLKEDTVTEHLDEARRRCGVSRRTELVVHTLFNGDLTFNDIIN
jgi:LuxR family transcriptional regulator, quorum-sensing system regulator CciR